MASDGGGMRCAFPPYALSPGAEEFVDAAFLRQAGVDVAL
jgi:hypothetical protein